MRQIQVLVPDDQLESVTDVLDEEEVDYVRQRTWRDGREEWLVEFPVPTDAIGYLLERLGEAGVDEDQYTVITSVEAAMTPHSEELQERFAADFDPLTVPELRSKARDMSSDTSSFLAMIVLSAVIATAGLLVSSPAVVVGSMVIAPIVGPVLTASTGAVTDDREMVLGSLWLQAIGLVAAIAGAGLFAFGLQFGGFLPRTLDVASIDLIALRVAPSVTTVVIGLASGAAGAFGLTTKGPTSLIGVMIAAALIPAAATVGIAAAWGEYRVAVGSLLLLLLTMVVINIGSLAVLQWFYGGAGVGWLPSDSSVSSARRLGLVAAAIVLVALVVLVGVGSYQQIAFERTVQEEVEATIDQPEYASLEPVSVRIQYSGAGPFRSPETVTVTVSRANGGDPPQVAGELDRRIADATDRDVTVRVRFETYQRSDDASLDSEIGENELLLPDGYGPSVGRAPSPAVLP